MDRRQRKSREAIFRAFSALLTQKRYEHISVQEIINLADVGRSTFYAHFETKDMLLKAMCSDIFDHIFAGDVCSYADHDHSLQSRLAHILWHLQERKQDVTGILACESAELFLSYFRERLPALFSQYMQNAHTDVPEDFWSNHLAGSFTEAVRWWVRQGMIPAPETLAEYYIRTLP